MFKEHSIMKILAHILLAFSFLISISNGADTLCKSGTCILAENCTDAKVSGFNNYCGMHPLKACCSTTKDYFGHTPSGLACKEYSYKLCNGTNLIAIVGIETKKYEYPYMVNVGTGGKPNGKTINSPKYNCGGTLIHEKFVLTAAHCTTSEGNMFVRLGGYNLTDGVHIKVKNITLNNIQKSMMHDIALLELERPVEFDRSIMPACLPRTSGEEILNFIGLGWGYISFDETKPKYLMKIELRQFKTKKCEHIRKNVRTRYNICAGTPNLIGDVCNGDSGGPLAITHPESCLGQVFGIVGRGNVCTSPGAMTIHSRVFQYLEWIEKIVWPSNK